ncbi:Similar to hypothetical protein [Tuber melanosporum Mel28]; acc. no. XP_002838323 [Pyronema omphalodes CBS 100304]|uniref:Uncharacterized protein n=1 Tax=Pyronema omphalodes (strain CBS 100304) TaxID=1076935 RepID=U4L4X8_PYROM|nr:Similar to hypothetical protein [Tuber melanosporum Mel28]; acc. no. XP_002838323 [Pyronema omphalodes CBS 100304]
MATEIATAPVVETDKSVSQRVSPSRSVEIHTTPSKKNKTASTTSPPYASSSASAAQVVSNTEAPTESDSPKRNEQLPKIIVKKEPTSPEPPTRHRPPKLHLANNDLTDNSSVPRTAGGSLSTMRDVGMACLSPGFATHDPEKRENVQRSISVRDQQRSIIEARLQRHAKPGGGKDGPNEPSSARAPGSSHGSKRRPPNSLTIVPPPHRAFANERVVQSAPLNQSFTGRHPGALHPPPQHTHNPHHVNRLPPISDVFGPDRGLDSSSRSSRPMDLPQSSRSQYHPQPNRPPQPSPNSMSFPTRSREHRSAEEALQMLSGGREDLLPRIVHYGGHQPPTPPSPPQAHPQHTPSKPQTHSEYRVPQSAGRRRTRAEYERDDEFSFGSRDSPETKKQKKEEFLSLCARAWELFHS